MQLNVECLPVLLFELCPNLCCAGAMCCSLKGGESEWKGRKVSLDQSDFVYFFMPFCLLRLFFPFRSIRTWHGIFWIDSLRHSNFLMLLSLLGLVLEQRLHSLCYDCMLHCSIPFCIRRKMGKH